MIGKYVEKFFHRERSSPQGKGSSLINEEMLKKYGFGD
jgi:hypothetical protein